MPDKGQTVYVVVRPRSRSSRTGCAAGSTIQFKGYVKTCFADIKDMQGTHLITAQGGESLHIGKDQFI